MHALHTQRKHIKNYINVMSTFGRDLSFRSDISIVFSLSCCMLVVISVHSGFTTGATFEIFALLDLLNLNLNIETRQDT